MRSNLRNIPYFCFDFPLEIILYLLLRIFSKKNCQKFLLDFFLFFFFQFENWRDYRRDLIRWLIPTRLTRESRESPDRYIYIYVLIQMEE